MNAQPRFSDLMEIPIFVSGEGDGSFDRDDYVLFYARGPLTWKYNPARKTYVHVPNAYDDYSYAFITVDQGEGSRIAVASTPTGNGTENVSEFLDRQVYDEDNYNIINGGRNYYGEIIDGTGSVTKDFSFPNLKTDRLCSVAVNLAGRNFKPASFQLLVDDVLLKTFNISTTQGDSQHAFANEVSGVVTSSVNIIAHRMESDTFWRWPSKNWGWNIFILWPRLENEQYH